jgi:anti-sigma B factor antagonist
MNDLQIELNSHAATGKRQRFTCKLSGNLDNSTVASLDASLKPALAAPVADLVLDLAALKFVTSVGIRLFFRVTKELKQRGGTTSFVNLQPQINEVFDIMGRLPEMRVFRDQDQMNAYLLLGEEDGAPFSFSNDAELDAYLKARQHSYQK